MIEYNQRSYPALLKELLITNPPTAGVQAIDLFCGCGGLTLGLEAAGLQVNGIDSDADAVRTCRRNLTGTTELKHLGSDFACPPCDVLVAGPPCQPFSVLGSNLGRHDERNGFPVFISAVQEARPKVWMFENVTGLLRQKAYLETILRKMRRLGYKVESNILNAANFGVPQSRRRLVVIGWKKGIFAWPKEEATKWSVGDAIGRSMTRATRDARWVTSSMASYIQRYEEASKCIRPRDLDPSSPARTVTCRNLSGATGDMLRVRLRDGRRRMLTIREAARLQSFPDWYKFVGSTSSVMNQIGNAVPPMLAMHLGKALRDHLR